MMTTKSTRYDLNLINENTRSGVYWCSTMFMDIFENQHNDWYVRFDVQKTKKPKLNVVI